MSDEHSWPHEGQEEYQSDRVHDEAERDAKADALAALTYEKHRSHRRIAIAQLLAYVLIVAVFSFNAWQDSRQDDSICASAQENRDATRALVVAIGDLGEELVVGSDTETAPTPEQQATLDQFTEFQAQQLKALSGPVCHD